MNIFKVPASSIPFLRNLILTNKANAPLTLMAAGSVLSQHALLSPQPVGSPSSFFLTEGEENIFCFIDSLLDVIPINTKQIIDYGKKFYCVRHTAAHGSPLSVVTGNNSIYNLFQIGVNFSNSEIELLEKSGEEFSGLVTGFEIIYNFQLNNKFTTK